MSNRTKNYVPGAGVKLEPSLIWMSYYVGKMNEALKKRNQPKKKDATSVDNEAKADSESVFVGGKSV